MFLNVLLFSYIWCDFGFLSVFSESMLHFLGGGLFGFAVVVSDLLLGIGFVIVFHSYKVL